MSCAAEARLALSGVGRLTALVLTVAAALAVVMLVPASSRAAALSSTPYMGWNTYYGMGGKFDETAVESVASSMINTGLVAAGYRIVWLDFGWASGARDSTGQLLVDPNQWPDGMAGLAAWLHAHGLLAGIYTDAGRSGCKGEGVGSYGHYQQDADTFAAWGFDAVKVDFCGAGQEGLDPRVQYAQFADALSHNASNRPMILNVCNFWVPGQIDGVNPTLASSSWDNYQWAPAVAQSWRTDTDIGYPGNVQFKWVLRNLDRDATHPESAGPGHWNDPDYLNPQLGMSGTEAQSQFSMWAMLAAPLILGSDPRSLTQDTISMLENPQVIAIDQDPFGAQGSLAQPSGGSQVWLKPLANGDTAVALLNRGASAAQISTSASELGLAPAAAYQLQDVWANTSTTTNGPITAEVPSHGVALYRVTPQGGTGAAAYPLVTTQAPSSLSATSGTLNGIVYPNGADSLYSFQYGPDISYGSDTAPIDAGSGTAAAAAGVTLTGLQPGTTYHYRLCAGHSVSAGRLAVLACGVDQQFQTHELPVATTAQASGISTTGAVLNGTVNPNGVASIYHFEYSTDPSLQRGVVDAPATAATAGSGKSARPHSVPVRGLQLGTTYYFRIVAASAGGTSYGLIQAFRTLVPPRLSGLSIRPRVWRTSAWRGRIERVRPVRGQRQPRFRGALITYIDHAAARTRFIVLELVGGVRRGRRCVRDGRTRVKRSARCVRTVTMGSFAHLDVAGRNRLRFIGRLGGHQLQPGVYRLKAVAQDAGGTSRPVTATFRVMA